MLVNVRRTFGQFVRQEINEVLHEVALSHEQVLTDVRAVTLQLILREQDVKELLIGLLMSCLYPLLQLIDIQIVLFSLEGCLE